MVFYSKDSTPKILCRNTFFCCCGFFYIYIFFLITVFFLNRYPFFKFRPYVKLVEIKTTYLLLKSYRVPIGAELGNKGQTGIVIPCPLSPTGSTSVFSLPENPQIGGKGLLLSLRKKIYNFFLTIKTELPKVHLLVFPFNSFLFSRTRKHCAALLPSSCCYVS